jgi:glycosyltransferase involved in cell wall biosynthesis
VPDQLPSVSAVVPTLNAQRKLASCLRSLRAQTYAGALEIILVDAGSSDRTLEIAAEFRVDRVLANPLLSGEAGKAIGVKAAHGELVLLIDSDNELIGSDWLERMVKPFIDDPGVIGCEPARFAYLRTDHFINRWHALLGTADPLTLYVGNYARDCVLTGRWTDYPVKVEPRQGWQRLTLEVSAVPTIGANGFIIRRGAYDLLSVGDYLFDIDFVFDLVVHGQQVFARVDAEVRHQFCDGIAQFASKTERRVDDYFFFRGEEARSYPWTSRRRLAIVKFAASTVAVVPLLVTALRGYRRVPDAAAWAWHPIACWLTFGIYLRGTVRGWMRPRMLSREGWRQ